MAFDTELLEAFTLSFLGYGNPHASLWFVGMEEGGGKTQEEIQARLSAWDNRGQRQIEDMRAFCQATRHPALLPYSGSAAPYNRTWCGLIQELHQQLNRPLDSAVAFQRTNWLTTDGDTCLLNLMPLPSPNVETWNYNQWSDLPSLQNRDIYLEALIPKRIAALRAAIQTFAPQTVICVGKSYSKHWNQLQVGISKTKFEIITHPSTRSYGGITLTENKKENQNMQDQIMDFFTSGDRCQKLKTPFPLPVWIGYKGRGKIRRLCLELKEIEEQNQISFINKNEDRLNAEMEQISKWDEDGYEGTGRGIFALYQDEQNDTSESGQIWALRVYPKFEEAVKQIIAA